MNACSIVLYIITERWPGAKRYRDMYEAVKQSVLESIEESKYEPRRAVKRLNPGLFGSIDRKEEGAVEVSRMVADMAGESVPTLLESLCGTDLVGASVPGADVQLMDQLTNQEAQNGALSAEMDAETLDTQSNAFHDSFREFQHIDMTGFDFGGFQMSHGYY
jgi:hypothetical protein